MQGVVTVSVVPIAIAFVVGIGGFVALLPLLLADQSRMRAPRVTPVTRVDEAPAPHPRSPEATRPVPVALPARASRFRLVVSLGALVAWSVWSVRRPHDRGRQY
ncbi:MAG: hypothetical protein U0W40_02845 [Acidimicrobiia bacterium]